MKLHRIFVVALSLCVISSVWAQEKQVMTIVDLLEVPQLRDPQLSPQGTALAYTVAEADWQSNKRITHIWLVRTSTENVSVQLTFGESGEHSPRWSPDGDHIAFLAKRSGDTDEQIYLLRKTGEASRLSQHDTAVSNIQWSPDGKFIYFIANDPKTSNEKKKDKLQDDVFAYDEDYKQQHLWRIAVGDQDAERITSGNFSVATMLRGNYRISRDGSKIAHHRTPTPLYDNSDEGEVWLMSADGTGAVQLTDNTVAEFGATLSPDGQWVLFRSDSNEAFDTYYNDNIFIVPAKGGNHRMLLAEMPHEVQDAHWSKEGDSIYFTANTGVRSALFQVAVQTGELTQRTQGDQSLSGWQYSPQTERHVFGIDERTNAGDVYTIEVGNVSGSPRQLTDHYGYLEKKFRLPRQEDVQWKGDDGANVEGLLYYPLDYQEGTRYPLVVQTHGGPASSDRFGFGRWSSYVQVLTARGYFVFKPNYRGSTGYGDAVLRDMVGHYYRQSHLDVMTGVDYLIEQGLVDGTRMAKMGWSGGGHMTNKIITHTNRFKAASSGAGAVNWISMYGTSDVRIYRTPWFGGTPWQEDAPIDLYWGHSPLKDIYKANTPTIILVGANDVRVPVSQSIELYRALKTNGVLSHLYIAPREPHGWQELRHELFKVNVELDWFEKHVREIDYEWEVAPGDS